MKRVALLRFGFLLACAFGAVYSGLTSVMAADEQRIVAGSEIGFPPYAHVDRYGNAQGFSVDLLQAVAQEEGLDLRVEVGPWSKVRKDLEEGRVDVLPFVAWSPERAEKFDFTSHHVTVYDFIFRRKGDARVLQEADLKDKTILVMEGDSAHDYLLKSKITSKIQVTKTLDQALLLLNAGEGDAVMGEKVAGMIGIQERLLDKVEPLPRPIAAYDRKFSFAVKKGNTRLLGLLEQGLAAVRIKGEYQKIYNHWLSSVDPLKTQAVEAERSARVSKFTAEVVGFLAILGFIGLWFLWKAFRQKSLSLEQTEATFFQILDSLPDLVLVKGPGSKIVWANRAFRDYYGMSLAQLKDMIDAPFSPPDYTQQYVKDDLWVFENGQVLSIPEEPVTRHDGVLRKFHTVKAPLFDAEGKVYRTVGVSRDITERLEQERKLAEQKQQMMVSSKMSALGEMASGIAHEINNPLTIISVTAQRLGDMVQAQKVDLPKLEQFSKRIDDTTMRIAAIVKALRSFARDGSQDPFQEQTVGKVVNDTLELCRERFRNHSIELSVEMSVPSLTLHCRAVQVCQVLLNLLNNAFDAVSDGKSETRWVKLSITEKAGFVEFSVTDSGPGVPAEFRDKLMQPFFTTKEVGKGTGLGLSVSRGLAEAHQGSLELDPLSVHTRFVLRLPRKQNAVAAKAS